MATNFFGNARKNEFHYHYYGLSPKDLEKLTFWGYLKISLFLIGVLIFWIICGWSASYCLPIQETIELLAGCFSGNFSQKLNHFQAGFSRDIINSRSSDHNLTNSYSKAQIILEIFERLNIDDPEVKSKIGAASKAIKAKRREINHILDSRTNLSTQRLLKIQNQFFAFQRIGISDDYDLLDAISQEFVSLSFEVRDSETDRIAALETIKAKIQKARATFNPIRFDILDNLEITLENLLSSKLSSSMEASSLESRLNQAFAQRKEFADQIKKLLAEREQLLEDISFHKKSISDLEEKNSSLSKQIKNSKSVVVDLSNDRKELLRQLNGKDRNIEFLNSDNKKLEDEIKRLEDSLRKKARELQSLEKQLNEFLEQKLAGVNPGKKLRKLSGYIIGNINNSKSKYHFSVDCPHYWSYVGQYMYSSDEKANYILTSNNESDFIDAGLNSCDICSKK